MTADPPDAERTSLWDGLADLIVYAPIGLTLDAQDLAPDLARRGRQHTAAARRIGEFAVKAGMRRLDELVTAIDPSQTNRPQRKTMASSPSRPAPATHPGQAVATAGAGLHSVVDAVADDSDPSSDPEVPAVANVELPIPDYDLLAASQVVKRLDGLDPDQLDAVRRHEEAGRGRRTILHKITRLQAA